MTIHFFYRYAQNKSRPVILPGKKEFLVVCYFLAMFFRQEKQIESSVHINERFHVTIFFLQYKDHAQESR